MLTYSSYSLYLFQFLEAIFIIQSETAEFIYSKSLRPLIQIFANDSVVESLNRFKSLFYDALALGFKLSGSLPDSLESVLRVLYALSKLLLIILIFCISSRFSNRFWFFLLMGAWVSHTKPVPVGNILLFKSLITHDVIAFLLGLTALLFLFRKNNILFWLCLGLSIFVHSLMAFHLFLCVVPPLLLIDKSHFKKHVSGLVLLIVCSLLYLWLMAPPSLSNNEASIFLAEMGNCVHVSPLNQNIFGWAEMLGLIILGYMSYVQILKHNECSKMITQFILYGTFIGLFLSFSAIITKLSILALFQPMRIFIWVTFLANLLIALAASKSLRQNTLAGTILIGVLVTEILYSQWFLIFVIGAIVYLFMEKYWTSLKRYIPFSLDNLTTSAIAVLVFAMFIAWKVKWSYFQNPLILFVGLVMFLMSLRVIRKKFIYTVLLFILMLYSVGMTSVFNHDYFAFKRNPDWDIIRLWCRNNTEKDDVFITPPYGNNFRILSLRSTVSENMQPLLWIDPFEHVSNSARIRKVEQGYSNLRWNLNHLLHLAQKWQVDYVITEGAYEPDDISPIFSSGPYAVFKVLKRIKSNSFLE